MTSRGIALLLALNVGCVAGCIGQTRFSAGADGGGDSAPPADAGRLGDAQREGTVAEAGRTDAPSTPPTDGGRSGVAVSGNLSFGAVGCGSVAKPGTVTVWNEGDAGFTFDAKLGRQASPFAITFSRKVVDPHDHVTIAVTPLPIPQTSPVPGTYADTLTVTTDARDDAPHLVQLSESAEGAILAFDTQNIPFGDVPVSTAQSAIFHVVNTGSVAATVQLGMGTQTGSSFSVTPTDAEMVSDDVTLTASATFSPTTATGVTGSVVIVPAPGTVLCGPLPAPLTLTGIGENGGLTVDNNAITFGPTPCGQQAAAQALKLTNSGNSSLTWSLTLSNTSPSPYTVTPETTGSLAAGASVSLTITPGQIPAQSSVQSNFYSDTVTINTDVIGDEPHVITLSQTATGAILAFNPTSVGFGDAPVNTTATQPFQVVNTGNAPASVTLTSSAPSFGVTGPASVPPGKEADFTGSFSPGSTTTPQSASITMSAGASTVLCAPLPLPMTVSGTGTSGVVAFSPGALTFGDQATAGLTACGTQASPQQVTFTNAGNQAYTIAASLEGAASSPYAFTLSPASGVVAASGGTATLTVIPAAVPATSAVPGNYNDTLTVTTNVAGDTPHHIALSESAYGAILSAPEASVSFPGTPEGGQSTSQIGITNSGNAPATLTWNAISNAVFAFDENVILPPGGVTTNENAYFTPTAAMVYMATATMGVSAATVLCQPVPNPGVTLTGTGTNSPVVSVTPNPIDFNMVPCGTSGGARTVTIKNSSAATITWKAALTTGTSFSVAPASGSIATGATGTLTVTSNVIPVSSSTTTAANAFGDTLTVTTNAVNDTPHAIPVQETASGAILAWSPATLNLPLGQKGQPVPFSLQNSGNLQASVTLALTNPGPATLTLNAPTSGTSANGAPFQGSVTEAVLSVSSTNATVSVTPANGTILCQPAPSPMPVTAN